MSFIHQRGLADVHGNLTPMIDMAFLLIVFFVLVARIVDFERVELDLPRPREPAAQRAGEEQRVVVNVLPDAAGRSAGYRVGTRQFAPDAQGVAALAQQLGDALRINPQVQINVRADRATAYEWVEPVLAAVAGAARSAGNATGDPIRGTSRMGTQARPRVNLMLVQERP